MRFLFFDSLWWLALINTVALYIFIPLILFLPLAVLCRYWRLFTALCFPLGLFIGLYSSFFLPSLSTPAPQNQPIVKAMTFNMLFDNGDYDADDERQGQKATTNFSKDSWPPKAYRYINSLNPDELKCALRRQSTGLSLDRIGFIGVVAKSGGGWESCLPSSHKIQIIGTFSNEVLRF